MTEARNGRRRKPAVADEGGMGYLESLPRKVVVVYIPLVIFLVILLFPFYFMGVVSFKTHEELYEYRGLSALWIHNPTLEHIKHLLFETEYPRWLWNTMFVTVASTFLSIFASGLRRLCHRAAAILRIPLRGHVHLPRLPGAPQHPVHSARGHGVQDGRVRQPAGP